NPCNARRVWTYNYAGGAAPWRRPRRLGQPSLSEVAGMTQDTGMRKLPENLFGYEVLAFLGEGAASYIYAVSDPASKQIYALKHVLRKTDKDDRFIEQLEAEYEVGRHVRHPALRNS